MSDDDKEEEEEIDEEDDKRIFNKYIFLEDDIDAKKAKEQENKDFPDEVDTPDNIPARFRFMKYRGLESFRTSPWDPKENLPREYNQLFEFQNFPQTQKRVLEEAERIYNNFVNGIPLKSNNSSEMEEDEENDISEYVEPCQYVTITLIIKDKQNLIDIQNLKPVIISSLLEHEEKMSVIHTRIQRNDLFYSDPVKSKDLVEIHIGFRRQKCRPIYSEDNLNCDKHKFERFLYPNGFRVATYYGYITYEPSPVILFHYNEEGNIDSPIAHGSLLSVDPNRIILKRVILTGYPLKCHKKTATVRFMFWNPDDIKFFKPIQLITKNGLTGNIREPLGTHGRMKCYFNEYVKQSDIVCLNLYKRVFPKMANNECISE